MYSLPDGLKELRRLVAQKHYAQTGVVVDPDQNVIKRAVSMQGFSILFHIITEPSDEIIVTDLYFVSHSQQVTTTPPDGAFGPSGEHHLRMAYCVPEDTINRAFDSLKFIIMEKRMCF